MKILKRYILELCFILSFTFLMEHAIVTAVFIYSFLIAFLLKNDGRNGLRQRVISSACH